MTSSRTSDDSAESVVKTINERRPTVAPADLVLLALPVLLAVGWVAGVLSALSLDVAVAVAALPALATLGYALFYNPPSGQTS